MSVYPRMLVSLLQVKYPDPRTCSPRASVRTGYCVGGALCLEHHSIKDSFPDEETLGEALKAMNSSLEIEEADSYARSIIGYNDSGKFDLAWRELERALTWHGAAR